MRLSAYAKQNGITYGTAYKYWKQGIIKGKQLSTGTIFIENMLMLAFKKSHRVNILFPSPSDHGEVFHHDSRKKYKT